MERLTYRSPRFNNPVSNGACEKIKCSAKCDSCKINDLIAKLCAYEDTGLEPEEIADFMKRWEQAVEIGGMLKKHGIDHIRDLIHAEQDGRLVVPPCKTGDTVYEVTSRKTISEYRVKAIHVELFCTFIELDIIAGFVDKFIFGVPVDEIGKTVFLTREEAEAALKGGEG